MGTTNEMISCGGEVEFIKRIIDESCLTRLEITWFTSLVGIKVHLKQIAMYLEKKNVSCQGVYNFTLGRTTRWIVYWSFQESNAGIVL